MPIIFTTAYHDFFLPAFETHGIAYLLKPLSLAKLTVAWQKFLALRKTAQPTAETQLQQLLRELKGEPQYPSRLPIKQQQQTYFLELDQVVYIKADGSVLSAFDQQNKRHYLPFRSLAEAEVKLDPKLFFRINRSEMVRGSCVERLERYQKNTLAVTLTNGVQLQTSESRTAAFGQWLGVSG